MNEPAEIPSSPTLPNVLKSILVDTSILPTSPETPHRRGRKVNPKAALTSALAISTAVCSALGLVGSNNITLPVDIKGRIEQAGLMNSMNQLATIVTYATSEPTPTPTQPFRNATSFPSPPLSQTPQILRSPTPSPTPQIVQPTDIPEDYEQKEKLAISPPVAQLDFAPEKINSTIQQIKPTDNDSVLKRILGPNYLSKDAIDKLFGPHDWVDPKANRLFFQKVYRDHPNNPDILKLAIAYGVLNQFDQHGVTVASFMNWVWENNDVTTKPVLYPLQDVISEITEVTESKDGLHNKIYWSSIEPEDVIEALKNFPEQKIVNMSFQIGKFGFVYKEKDRISRFSKYPNFDAWTEEGGKTFYIFTADTIPEKYRQSVYTDVDGKQKVKMSSLQRAVMNHELREQTMEEVTYDDPQTDVIGAYSIENPNAKENVKKLIRVCKEYPKKLFFAAAGNWKDDVRTIREELKDEWPDNLILTAEWSVGDEKPANDVYGADVYITLPASGSSLTTGVSSALFGLVAYYEGSDFSPQKAKQRMLDASARKDFPIYDFAAETEEIETAQLLDPETFKVK